MSRLRKHFGTAGLLVAVVALVAAVGGSAIAAENSGDSATASAKKKKKKKRGQAGLNGKQKRQVIALAKRFAGNGPQGPQGLPGANGLPGIQGVPGVGTKGATGANGKSAEVIPSAGGIGEPCENLGGAEVKVEGAPGGEAVCNGEAGSPWPAGGTLPEGATQTGAWSFATSKTPEEGAAEIQVPLSFSIPLAEGLDAPNYAGACWVAETCAEGSEVHFINPEGKELTATFAEGLVENPPHCPGSAENPEAESGHLCVYAAEVSNAHIGTAANTEVIRRLGSGAEGASTSGARLRFVASALSPVPSNSRGYGAFAVTG